MFSTLFAMVACVSYLWSASLCECEWASMVLHRFVSIQKCSFNIHTLNAFLRIQSDLCVSVRVCLCWFKHSLLVNRFIWFHLIRFVCFSFMPKTNTDCLHIVDLCVRVRERVSECVFAKISNYDNAFIKSYRNLTSNTDAKKIWTNGSDGNKKKSIVQLGDTFAICISI